MSRNNGTPTTNLSVNLLSPTDDFNKATFNEVLSKLDTRVNIVADETQALGDHESDTTNVHGIADTSALTTATDVATAVSDHSADTTSVHGIADTSHVVVTTDTPQEGDVLTWTSGAAVWAAP